MTYFENKKWTKTAQLCVMELNTSQHKNKTTDNINSQSASNEENNKTIQEKKKKKRPSSKLIEQSL